MLDVTFSMDEINMCFKGRHAEKLGLRTKQKMVDYIHMIFLRKDTYIKYIYVQCPCVKTYLSKRCSPLDAKLMALFDTSEKKPSMHNG